MTLFCLLTFAPNLIGCNRHRKCSLGLALMDYPQFTLSFSAFQQMPFFRLNRLPVSTTNWVEHLLPAPKTDRGKIGNARFFAAGIGPDTALQPHPLNLSKNHHLTFDSNIIPIIKFVKFFYIFFTNIFYFVNY